MSALPLYRRVLGDKFSELCPRVRALHEATRSFHATGRCDVRSGTNWVARLLAFVAGMPPEGNDVPLTFDLEVFGERERWTRDFAGHRFSSVMWNKGTALFERLGPTTFQFALEVDGGTLRMVLQRGWVFGVLPLPRFALPTIRTVESCRDDLYCFEVSVSWPVIGLVVEYRGTLRG